ncbi:MAG TPA: hydrogenase [Firmicutes bacterium]|jgi:Ni,Fe-hydrogenase III small subunit/ferredoxin|nr:hydrogenase [Bacillota bacterium]
MLNIIKKIIQYPRLTGDYPKKPFKADFMIGKPLIDGTRCNGCGECVKRCPAGAIQVGKSTNDIGINIDQCIFCALCEEVCPQQAVTITHEFELAERERQDLHKGTLVLEERNIPSDDFEVIGKRIEERLRKKLRRSLQIREVDAGSCNGCDTEINALTNPLNDLERFGIHFVASPRHADMLLVTGTACRNMELALIKTYNATPDPKLVVAVGACACSGGIFRESHVTRNGIDSIVPVDIYIPGCPPRPQAIIYGILKALDRV